MGHFFDYDLKMLEFYIIYVLGRSSLGPMASASCCCNAWATPPGV